MSEESEYFSVEYVNGVRHKIKACCRRITQWGEDVNDLDMFIILKYEGQWVLWDRDYNLVVNEILFCPFCGKNLE